MDAVGSMFDIAHLSANKEPRISVYKIGQTRGPLRWNINDSHGASKGSNYDLCAVSQRAGTSIKTRRYD